MKQNLKAYEYERIALENERIKDQLAIKRDKLEFIKNVKESYKQEMGMLTSETKESKIKKFFKKLFKVL